MLLPDLEAQIQKKHDMAIQGIKEMIVPYTPSSDQQEIHDKLTRYRFGVAVVHRGFGKSWLAVNELVRRAWSCTSPHGGRFLYVAPEKLHAKKIVWRELKYFVKDLPHSINEAELVVTFPNGSSVELAGADNPDRLRGMHPHYVVLDEVAQMPRDMWYEVIYPALQANQGGALFIGTPKGDNLFKELYDLAKKTPGWFAHKRNVFETRVFTPEAIEELQVTMPTAKFEQEYMCSFDAAYTGTYYAPLIAQLKLVGSASYDPAYPVLTGWDLGTADDTVIWFAQQVGNKIHLIDYYESNNKDFFHYIGVIKHKPYLYSYHVLPHDVNNRSWETGKSRLDYFRQHGMRVQVAPKTSPQEGISVVQTHLYRCVFDLEKCETGIRHMMQYCSKRDKLTGHETGEPAHNGSEHCADAFRTMIMGMKKPGYAQPMSEFEAMFGSSEPKVITEYDYFN